MENYYFNGELFLKKGPEPINQMTAIALNEMFPHEEKVQIGALDYSGTDEFFELYFSDGQMFLRNVKSPLTIIKKEFVVTPKILKEKYEKLSDFLKNSEYIGRKGFMKSASENGDKSYCNVDNKQLVLYKDDNRMIIYYQFEFNKEDGVPFIILNKSYLNDWEFDEKFFDYYSDREKFYKLICDYIKKQNTMDNRNFHM